MRYNKRNFNNAVAYYKKQLQDVKGKSIMIAGSMKKSAFYSLAPLSQAIHELGKDVYVSFTHNIPKTKTLFKVWDTYDQYKKKIENKETKALKTLFEKINIKELNAYFSRPDLILKIGAKGFVGDLSLQYRDSWFSPFMATQLRRTTDAIVKNVFAVKKSEKFSIGFVLLPKKLAHPWQDYLDSYAISYNMFLSAKNVAKSVVVKSSSSRNSMHAKPEKISELSMTLTGLELEKDINMPVFKAYKNFAKALDLKPAQIAQASFFVSSHGYHGKHIFGEQIGYPTKNMKTKWNSPGGMIYKFHWYPQAALESRPPLSRVSFTSTVPIDKLVESCDIDYKLMRKRNKQIGDKLSKCDVVYVQSHIKKGCQFEVGLVKKDGSKRLILRSDSDTRTIINPLMLKKTGQKTGRMANIPGGEAFTTPSYVKGTIVGDVVINVDKSYRLSKKEPLIAVSDKKGYKIVSGPKDVVKAFNKRKKEAWKNIEKQEKNKSLSKEIISLKKKNFEHIGEFAINTNPKATLCDYLIINEKIANMIHVAFGSGFEADTATEYHMDVVVDAPRQKLDIFGKDSKGKEHWILRKGKFVI